MSSNKKYKLDIFKLLKGIDNADYSFWSKLSDEERKGFSPLITMRWMTGTSDERQIIALNTFANKLIFSLGKHPELLIKLFTACSSKMRQHYYWQPVKSGNKSSNIATRIIQQYFSISEREAKMYNVSSQELLKMAEELGLQNEDIALLRKEIS